MNHTGDLNGQDTTKDLTEDLLASMTDSEKLNLLLREMGDVKTRLTRLETIAEDRSRDTAPMLGRIHKEIADTRQELHELRQVSNETRHELQELRQEVNTRFDALERTTGDMAKDQISLRVNQEWLADRISALEKAA